MVAGLLFAVGVLAQTATDTTSGTTPSPQTTCTTGGGKWCINSDQVSGWCSYSSSPCPAYDSASCAAQSGEWCAYTGGTGGYCNSVPGSCPINDQATCTSKSRTWCAGTSGGMGWCATTGSTCPANDAASCAAQSGEWCTSSYGGSGWCSSTQGSCPISDKATCESKSRTWCADSYSTGGGWCATTGSTCPITTPASNTTPATTYTPTTFSWPQSETECTKYKGVWCKYTGSYTYSMSTGYCNSAGNSCPSETPAGKMSCWDGTFVDTYSSCPTVPSTQTDCATKGYRWCASTASTYSGTYTGWCTGSSYKCPVYPPAGKMTCPDGETFAATIAECPTAAITPPPPTTKSCPDGTTVSLTATCPVYKTCSDGTKVLEGGVCPIKVDDPITTCLNKNGKWCLNKAGDSGYCILKGGCPVITDEGEKKVDQSMALDEKQMKLVENMKKEYARNLDALEKTFKKLLDAESLAKISSLKEKLGSIPMDSSIFDTLEAIKDDIMTLREIKDELIAKKGEIEMSDRDRVQQEKALRQMKKNIVTFGKQLDRIQSKMTKLQKQGFVIAGTLKELIAQGKDLIKKIQDAKTPEEAFDAGNTLADLSEDLNLWMPRLEQLARINQFSNMILAEINKRESEYKRVHALVKRLKIDLESYMGEVRTLLDSTREAYDQLKVNDWGENEPMDLVQEQIIDKLMDADDMMANIRALANLQASVNKIAAKIRVYGTRINRLARQRKDTTELKDLVDQLKDVYGELKVLAKEKLANLEISDVVEKFSAAEALVEQIDDLLKLTAPSALERALRGGLKVEKIETPELERQVIRAYRVATFFRRAPQQLAEYFSVSNVSSINRWRNRLAIDE